MGKRKDLSDFHKGQIVMARRLGQSISETAGLVGCSRSAVVSTFQKWSKEGQPVNRRQGHGRPRLIDARAERRLLRVVQTHRMATVAQIAEQVNAGSDKKVSEHTVHRSLLRLGLRNRRLTRTPVLDAPCSGPAAAVHRLQWAREHQNWTPEQWKKVVWSGQSRFSLEQADGRVRVRRLSGDAAEPRCGTGSCVTLWAMFCWETLGPALQVEDTETHTSYRDILANQVHPFMAAVFPDGSGLFQQDFNHTADVVQDWFQEHEDEFKVLPWPPGSPDISLMGQLWEVLEEQFRSMEPGTVRPEQDTQDLEELLLAAWCGIPQRTFRALVEAMPQRVKAAMTSQPLGYDSGGRNIIITLSRAHTDTHTHRLKVDQYEHLFLERSYKSFPKSFYSDYDIA